MKVYKCPHCGDVLEINPTENVELYCIDCDDLVDPELIEMEHPTENNCIVKWFTHIIMLLSFTCGFIGGMIVKAVFF